MKDKPSKWEFKYCVISDPSGYTCDFNLYRGAEQTARLEYGLAHDVVTSLVAPLYNQNYQLFCDNLHSSPALSSELLEHGITATGTLRVNRRGIPSDITTVKSLLQPKKTSRGKGYYIREKDSPHCLLLLERQPSCLCHVYIFPRSR